MGDEKEQGELKAIKFGEKVLTVYRRCSCGGDVEIKKDASGNNKAWCLRCGATLEWNNEQR